jgi:hypothetical protein
MYFAKALLARTFTLSVCLLAALLAPERGDAEPEAPYPLFVATYDVKLNGLRVGKADFRLVREGPDQYLYQQESVTTGVAAIFGTDSSAEQSHWRVTESGIQPLEYLSQREDGDDDDNAHLIFDWEKLRVKNIGAGTHWDIEMPEGTLDKMVLQLAMLIELREGATSFAHPVAIRGRIKTYRFELVGEDRTELGFGTYPTLKLERKDDDRDESWIWSAPDLNYFPVRFLKKKKAGLKVELLLRDVEFRPDNPEQEAEAGS